MICVYPADASDFANNGLCVLTPSACAVTETLNGEWELNMAHPLDDRDKWTYLQVGNILRAPVPTAMTPRVRMVNQTTGWSVYTITTKSGKLNLRSGPGTNYKRLGQYAKGKEVVLIAKTSDSWYEVTAPDGKRGYMSTDYLTFARTEGSSTTATGQVVESRQLREQPFRIYRVVPTLKEVQVYARHIFYDLMDNMILSYKPDGSIGGSTVANAVLSKCESSHDFTMYTDLTGSADGIEFEHINPVEAMLGDDGIIKKYTAELARDWYDVYLVQRVGRDTDVEIRQGKNLLGISYDLDESGVVTRIVPTGEDKDGNVLYLPEKHIDSPNISAYPHVKWGHLAVSDAKESDDTSKDAVYRKLREAAQTELDNGCDLPTVSLDVDFLSVDDTVEYRDFGILHSVYLGDAVRVVVPKLGLTVALRMTQQAVIDIIIVQEVRIHIRFQYHGAEFPDQRLGICSLSDAQQNLAGCLLPDFKDVGALLVSFRLKPLVVLKYSFDLVGRKSKLIYPMLGIGAREDGIPKCSGDRPQPTQRLDIMLRHAPAQMVQNTLGQGIIRPLDVAGDIHVAAIFFQDDGVRNHAGIAFDLFLLGINPHNPLDILLTQAILWTFLFESSTGVNEENAFTRIRVFLVDEHQAGGNAGAIEQVRRKADDTLDVFRAQHGKPDGLFSVAAEQDSMRHDDASLTRGIQGFQHMQEPGIITILFRRNTKAIKTLEWICRGFQSVTPVLIGKRRIHNHKVEAAQLTEIICELRVGQGIALQNGTGSLLMEDEVHPGQAGCGVILAKNGHDGIAVFANRCFVCSPDEQAAAACGRIVDSPILIRRGGDITNADQARNDAGHLAGRIELALALTGFLRELHHEVFVGVADNVVTAGAVSTEINIRILEDANQTGHFIDQFFSGTQFLRIIEADIGQGSLEMVVFQELLQDLINPLANVRFPFCCDQRVKGCFLGYREHRIGLSLIPVRHIFVEE